MYRLFCCYNAIIIHWYRYQWIKMIKITYQYRSFVVVIQLGLNNDELCGREIYIRPFKLHFYQTQVTYLTRIFLNPELLWFVNASASWNPFYQHGLTLIPDSMEKHIHCKTWEEITYSFRNNNGGASDVREWKNDNFIPHLACDYLSMPLFKLIPISLHNKVRTLWRHQMETFSA